MASQNPEPGRPPGSDEEVITQALRRSLIVLILLCVVAAGAVWWLQRRPVTRSTTLAPIQSPIASDTGRGPRPPTVRFTDITREAGIRFTHHNGAQGKKLLPETMGGGVACFDLDGDGDADLLFTNGTDWPDSEHATRGTATPILYRNDTQPGGSIRFTDITAGSGLDIPFYGMGVACGDWDGDSRTDLVLTGVGGLRLFRNLGEGRFVDITGPSGLPASSSEWSTAAAWFDLDRDGDTDVVVYHLNGPWFFGAAARLGAVLDQVSERPRALVVDFAAVPLIDSSGAYSFALLARKMARKEGRLVISGASAEVRRVLHQAGVQGDQVLFVVDLDAVPAALGAQHTL